MSAAPSGISVMLLSGTRSVVAAAVAAIAGAKPEFVEAGQVRDGSTVDLPPQAIFYANHSSHLDFVTLWAALPPRLRNRVRPVAAADYWSSGVKKAAAQGFFNAYLVERKGHGDTAPASSQEPAKSTGQIEGMNAVLDAGDSLIIFPEGTRGTGEQVARFQAGLYYLAQRNPEIPVIPVALANLGRILPKGETIPVPHLSTVRFHEPIRVHDGETKAGFLARAAAIINHSLRSLDPDSDVGPRNPGEPGTSDPFADAGTTEEGT